jgi:hypothetical protein
MDIWELIIVAITALFVLFGLPSPSGKIGKKVQKGYVWSRGLATIIYDKLYVKTNIVESFFWYVEELENFIMPNYSPSFSHMYLELLAKAPFAQKENRYMNDKNDKIQATYSKIKNVKKIERKGVFAQTVSEFKDLVIEISKMAQDIKSTMKDKNLGQSSVALDKGNADWKEYNDRYKFSATEFNNFLRDFRRFLDKTNCSHGIEISQYQLMQLLVPEDIQI